MGIFAEEIVTTDTLGRRTGPHNVNPNQVFAWRQLYRRGLLNPQGAKGDAKMLPVKVSTPTVLPTETVRHTAASQSSPGPKQASRLIEIRLRNGHSIVVSGRVDAEALSRVIDLLVQR